MTVTFAGIPPPPPSTPPEENNLSNLMTLVRSNFVPEDSKEFLNNSEFIRRSQQLQQIQQNQQFQRLSVNKVSTIVNSYCPLSCDVVVISKAQFVAKF